MFFLMNLFNDPINKVEVKTDFENIFGCVGHVPLKQLNDERNLLPAF